MSSAGYEKLPQDSPSKLEFADKGIVVPTVAIRRSARIWLLLLLAILLVALGSGWHLYPEHGEKIISTIWKPKLSNIWRSPHRFKKAPVLADLHSDQWRQNLRPEQRYITVQAQQGLGNIFFSIMNLLWLAEQTKRVAILPGLDPQVHTRPALWSRFSLYWDLPRFTELTGIPVIEWADIRANDTLGMPLEREHIGCWRMCEAMGYETHTTIEIRPYGIVADFWPLPPTVTAYDARPGTSRIYSGRTYHVYPILQFDQNLREKERWVKRITGDREKTEAMLAPLNRPLPDESWAVPDDQLLCFDDLYYLGVFGFTSDAFDHDFGYDEISVAFKAVGQYLHWTPFVKGLVDSMLAELIGTSDGLFIAIHLRRGDFGKNVPSLVDYERSLDRLQIQMENRWSDDATVQPTDLPIVFVTDAKPEEAEFWAAVRERGWLRYDHELHGTFGHYGDPWLAGVLDQALLSRAVGVVGTYHSTFSGFAMARAVAWQQAEVILTQKSF